MPTTTALRQFSSTECATFDAIVFLNYLRLFHLKHRLPRVIYQAMLLQSSAGSSGAYCYLSQIKEFRYLYPFKEGVHFHLDTHQFSVSKASSILHPLAPGQYTIPCYRIGRHPGKFLGSSLVSTLAFNLNDEAKTNRITYVIEETNKEEGATHPLSTRINDIKHSIVKEIYYFPSLGSTKKICGDNPRVPKISLIDLTSPGFRRLL